MDRDAIVREFTHQAASFNASPAMRSEGSLGRLVDLVPATAGERWLEGACGPGLVARALAPRVGEVVGVDLTPTMIDLAREEAAHTGCANVRFLLGDVASLEFEDGSFDGAVTRFSLHHIPVPGRVVVELARVVKPGGWVVVADHLTSEDAEVAAWHQEIERLRDPSHWACLSAVRLRALGAQAGLRLEREEQWPYVVDYEEWIGRGSGGPGNRELIARALAERDDEPPVFHVTRDPGGVEHLHLSYDVFVWQRPTGA
jgi:SAM-dependent methyltransferase